MTPLTLADIPSAAVFEATRDELRRAILAHKQARRVAVGDCVTLLFEDRETLRWQVLEMCRVEGIREPSGIQHEVDVYNELMPGPGELSATLFIEITESGAIQPELDRLVGIDEHVSLVVGDEAVRARFDTRQMEAERISAVQYLRFALGEEQAARLADPAQPLAVRIDHPAYTCQVAIGPETRRSLAADLRGDPEPLVDFAAAAAGAGHAAGAPHDAVLVERGPVRARRPATAHATAHVVVEPASEDPPSFGDASVELLAACMELAQEVARDIRARHGSCRLALDAEGPLRIHLFAPDA